MAANGSIVTSGPKTAAELAADINEELAELYTRSKWPLGGVSGTNTIIASAAPAAAFTSYVNGQNLLLRPAADNTAAATLNINSIGAKAVVTASGAALSGGELKSSTVYIVVYDGAGDHFRIIGGGGAGSSAATRQVFEASGTYTPPAGVLFVNFRVQGPGANGETGTGSSSNKRGGGSGTYGEKFSSIVDIGASQSVTVPAANSAAATSVGSLISCPGAPASGSATAAGSATGADFDVTGQIGDLELAATAGSIRASGAPSKLGHGGAANTTAVDGTGYGSGGNSGRHGGSNNTPGNGTGGVVIADEFYG